MAAWNWRRPLAEFVAIFAGVTLSLAADDWRDRQVDRAAEAESLGLLLADLKADSSQVAFAMDPSARYEDASVGLARIWDGPAITLDSASSLMQTFVFGNPYRPRNAAYASLRDSNGLGLIRTDSLRVAIVAYFDETQATLSFVSGIAEKARDEAVARLEQHGRWPRPRAEGSAWPLEGSWRLTSPFEALRADLILANKIQGAGVVGRIAGRERDRAIESNSRLRRLIEAELAQR